VKKILVLFLGRNTVRADGSGVLSEAREMFPGLETVVVAAHGDRLLDDEQTVGCLKAAGVVMAPEWGAAIAERPFLLEDKDFQPVIGATYVVVANGGMSKQLVPVLLRIAAAGCALEVFDLQRDGVARLWPE